MKSITDIDQSKILSKILSPKTANLWWAERFEGYVELNGDYITEDTPYYYLSFTKPSDNNYSQDTVKDIPCWSLVALLNVLPSATLDSSDDNYYRVHCMGRYTEWYDNPIDACYEMIVKLNEQKLL